MSSAGSVRDPRYSEAVSENTEPTPFGYTHHSPSYIFSCSTFSTCEQPFMDVSSLEPRTNMLEWDEGDVHAWFTSLGLTQYEKQIRGVYDPPCVWSQLPDG